MGGTDRRMDKSMGGEVAEFIRKWEFKTIGKYSYCCGYLMDLENIDIAIDNHEEEMRILRAEAQVGFDLLDE